MPVKYPSLGVPVTAQWVTNPTSIHEVQSLTSFSGLRIQHCCELWCRPAATALVQPLAWEPPYAKGAALKRPKKKKKEREKKEGRKRFYQSSYVYHFGNIQMTLEQYGCERHRPSMRTEIHL